VAAVSAAIKVRILSFMWRKIEPAHMAQALKVESCG